MFKGILRSKLKAIVAANWNRIQRVDRAFAHCKNADEAFRWLEGAFFAVPRKEPKTEPIGTIKLEIREPFEYTVVRDGDVIGSGTVNGIARFVGEFANGRKKFVKFVSHPFFQYGTI